MIEENIKITPELAEEWLKCNTNNRPVRVWTVDKYAREIGLGLWAYTSDPIKFDWNGRLIDGQHRLLACVKAGVVIYSAVARGLDPEVQRFIDQSVPRTAADGLHWRGEANANQLSAALNLMWRYERGILFRNGPPTPSPAEIQATLDKHPEIRESVGPARPAFKYLGSGGSIFLHYEFSLRSPSKCTSFFEGIVTGAGLEMDDPVRLLRQDLWENRMSKRVKTPSHIKLHLAIKAWNYHVQDRPLHQLRLTLNEAFPEILPKLEAAS